MVKGETELIRADCAAVSFYKESRDEAERTRIGGAALGREETISDSLRGFRCLSSLGCGVVNPKH
jgi:hypothetical protein